jgi:hypothetical protein
MTCENACFSSGREGEGAVELAARADARLGEDPAQVVLDHAGAEIGASVGIALPVFAHAFLGATGAQTSVCVA